MENVCIVGYGMVGNATAKLFGIARHFDIDEAKSNMTLEEVSRCRIVFICLPTPVRDGQFDTQPIFEFIKQIDGYGGSPVYVIRSTVFPGFAMHLQREFGINNVISNPEFLTEKTWEKDIKFPPFVLLGGLPGVFLEEIKGLYEARIKSAPVIVTDNTTAELAKLALNGFFVMKVVYANQIFDLCQSLEANYERLKEVLERHPFGYKNHAEIYHKGGRGAGGKCICKDFEALTTVSNSELLKMVHQYNKNLLEEYPKNEN